MNRRTKGRMCIKQYPSFCSFAYSTWLVDNNLKLQEVLFLYCSSMETHFFRNVSAFEAWWTPAPRRSLCCRAAEQFEPPGGYLTCIEISAHGRSHFQSTCAKWSWVTAIEPAYFWWAADGLANNLVQQLLWVTLVKYLHFPGLLESVCTPQECAFAIAQWSVFAARLLSHSPTEGRSESFHKPARCWCYQLQRTIATLKCIPLTCCDYR